VQGGDEMEEENRKAPVSISGSRVTDDAGLNILRLFRLKRSPQRFREGETRSSIERKERVHLKGLEAMCPTFLDSEDRSLGGADRQRILKSQTCHETEQAKEDAKKEGGGAQTLNTPRKGR